LKDSVGHSFMFVVDVVNTVFITHVLLTVLTGLDKVHTDGSRRLRPAAEDFEISSTFS